MTARDLWTRIETLHAVTYFCEESRAAAVNAGLKGFWMGYFAFRAAPLGPADAATVERAFANFAPAMVQRAIPDAWSYQAPAELVRLRQQCAAEAVRRLTPEIDAVAPRVNASLAGIVAQATTADRPLFAANVALSEPPDPVQRLWQLATCLREHRGDGHVIALREAGLDGCESHHVQAARHEIATSVLKDNRGWTDAAWSCARNRLIDRGLINRDGSLTAVGLEIRRRVEDETDRLAQEPIDAALTRDEQIRLITMLDPHAAAVARSGEIPFPNPMGLPQLDGRIR